VNSSDSAQFYAFMAYLFSDHRVSARQINRLTARLGFNG